MSIFLHAPQRMKLFDFMTVFIHLLWCQPHSKSSIFSPITGKVLNMFVFTLILWDVKNIAAWMLAGL